MHISHVALSKRHECLGLSGRGHELHFQTIRLIDLDNGSEITFPKVMLLENPVQHYRIHTRYFMVAPSEMPLETSGNPHLNERSRLSS